MATLTYKTIANNNTAAKIEPKTQRGFRLTGTISEFQRGMTRATKFHPSKPYICCKIDGQTTTGKKVSRKIMALGEKAIANLDINEHTAEAGVFVAYDRFSDTLIPVGPYKA